MRVHRRAEDGAQVGLSAPLARPGAHTTRAGRAGVDNANSRSGKQHTHLFTKTCLPDALLQSCPYL